VSPISRKTGSTKRRWRRATGIVTLTLLALVLVSTAVNLVMDQLEKSTTPPYGQRVPVAGGARNVWTIGRHGPTIVFLGGLGTASPALDYAPLARALRSYNVVVVEGFG
jgi:hypothetical protein